MEATQALPSRLRINTHTLQLRSDGLKNYSLEKGYEPKTRCF